MLFSAAVFRRGKIEIIIKMNARAGKLTKRSFHNGRYRLEPGSQRWQRRIQVSWFTTSNHYTTHASLSYCLIFLY